MPRPRLLPASAALLSFLLPQLLPPFPATAAAADPQPSQQPFPVTITIDPAAPTTPLPPAWRFFGADEPNYATMKNGQKLLRDLGALRPDRVYFRTHNLLTTGDGTPALKWGSTNAYTEDASGNPIYTWTILDHIFQTYLDNHVHPYVEVGFMPQALSTKPDPYQHRWTPSAKYNEIYTGWSHPPKDYTRWDALIYEWAQHCQQKWGTREVESWYWETWNEPNIAYWQGTEDEYLKLHDHTAAAIRRAIPHARIGGPDSAGGGGKWLKKFLDHCLNRLSTKDTGTGTSVPVSPSPLSSSSPTPQPPDFISFHAKGSPKYLDRHVRMGIANALKTVDDTFALIASYPELKHTPIILGEVDPDGCAACQGPQLAYRNTTLYPAYTAASFARIFDLAEMHHVNLEGLLTWAFEFEDQPYFNGMRVLSTNGIPLPILNLFRMYSKMGPDRLPANGTHAVPLHDMIHTGVRSTPDVSALATTTPDRKHLAVLLWHYHDDALPGPPATVTISLLNTPTPPAKITLYAIDQTHSNAHTAWLDMNSPEHPTPAQYQTLERSAQLQPLPAPTLTDGQTTLTLDRDAVDLLLLDW